MSSSRTLCLIARRIKPFRQEKLKWARKRRVLISECLSRRANTWEIKSVSLKDKLRGLFEVIAVLEEMPSGLMVLKSRSGNEDQRDLHRFDKVLVWAIDLMGRRKSIWWRITSGRSLILSMPLLLTSISFSTNQSFLRFADLVSMAVWLVFSLCCGKVILGFEYFKRVNLSERKHRLSLFH